MIHDYQGNKKSTFLFRYTGVFVLYKYIHQLTSSTTMSHTTILHHSIQFLCLFDDLWIPLTGSSHLSNKLTPHSSTVLVNTTLFQLSMIFSPLSYTSTSQSLLIELGTNIPHILDSSLLKSRASRHLTLPERSFGSLQLHSTAILRF